MSKADRPDHPQSSDRFNEDQATYSVKGSEAPDLEAGVAAIRNVLKTLPARPGVYRMQDARGDVLYVGKAKALRSRVTNYTQVTRLPSACSDGVADAIADHVTSEPRQRRDSRAQLISASAG